MTWPSGQINHFEANIQLHRIQAVSGENNIHWNRNKLVQITVLNFDSNIDILSANWEVIPREENFIYLGSMIKNSRVAYRHRQQLARVAAPRLHPLWTSNYPLTLQCRILQTRVDPVLTQCYYTTVKPGRCLLLRGNKLTQVIRSSCALLLCFITRTV